jgi:peptide/nickel transport system substrate-binding protein
MATSNESIDRAVVEYMSGGLSRRGFLQRAGLLGLGAVASGSILAACSSSKKPSTSGSAAATPTGAPVVGGTFREGYDRDFTPPDPVQNAWADPDFNAFFEALVIRDPQGALVPMLASAWTSTATGWTFTLRDGLTFQSGAPVTASVVVDNFKLFADPKTGQNAIFWTPIKSITSSGQTITCATTGPFQAFQETISTEYSFILNPVARTAAGKDWGSKVIDGTGPFQLDSYVPGNHVVGKRWEKYPGTVVPFFANKGKAYLDAVEWVPITQASQRAPEIETNNVDAVKNVPPQDIARLKSNSGLVVQEFQEISNFFLSLNMARTELGFDDVRVRQAISQSIDRAGIVKSIFLGHAVPTYGPVMPGYKWYNKAVEQTNQFDVDKAGTLFDSAGWTKGSDGVRTKNGQKLAFTVFNQTDETENQVMQALSQMLQNVGVKMTVSSLQSAAFTPKLATTTIAFAFKWLWSSPIDVAEIFGTAFQPTNDATNQSKAAYTKWQTAATVADLQQAAYDYQALYAQQLQLIPIYTPNTVWVHRKNVVGWSPNQVNLYPFYNDVWLAK